MRLKGRCTCGAIRYALTAKPLIVHACHCLDCQRITGGPFVINMWIEAKHVKATGAEPQSFRLKGGTGKRHEVFFCGACGTYVWSRYQVVPGDCLFVRAGTLDDPSQVAPDVHIYTRSKVGWVTLPDSVPAFDAYYDSKELWPDASLERLAALRRSE